MPFATEEDSKRYIDYFTFGLEVFKFDTILHNSEAIVREGDYTGCSTVSKASAMRKWYKYGFIYGRIWIDTPGGVVAKIKRVFS